MDAGVEATSGWAVGLIGGEWELSEIAPHLGHVYRLRREADGWELQAAEFERLNIAADIRTLATEIVGLINGVARVRLDSPRLLSVGNVPRYRAGGAKDVWAFPEPVTLRIRMGTPTVLVNGVAATPRSWEPDILLAASDDRVKAVLAFMAIEPSWHGLYAAFDTIVSDKRTLGRHGIVRWGAVTEKQLKAFTATANSYAAVGVQARHGPDFRRPASTMTLGEAGTLVGRIVTRWLGELGRLTDE